MSLDKVAGECPMGCGRTLFLGEGGHVTCSLLGCPSPGAVDELLHCVADPRGERPAVLGLLAVGCEKGSTADAGDRDVSGYRTIPDAAVEAGVAEVERITAAPDLEAERAGGETPEGFVVRATLTAALPHLVTDEMVERAAEALWDHREQEQDGQRLWHDLPPSWAQAVEKGLFPERQREVRAEARAALEAALVRDV